MTRTFDALTHYLKLRASVNQDKKMLGVLPMENLLTFYKLYDIMFVEHLINKCPIKLISMKEFKFNKGEVPIELDIDLMGAEFTVTTDTGDIIPATRYGDGHQSILNMLALTSS